MRLTRLKRALCLLLALAVALPLMAQPSGAAQFQDVTDEQVSLAADTLAALGVVSGTEEGTFSPDGHLTRAQLCKMAVEVMGMGEQAEAQAYRTIFTDMGKHWARGYVNLAATTEVPEESGIRLMLGLGDGKFGPNQEVTYQEAATLALRILGYGVEANRAWPYSAIETAAHLGLDRDLSIEKSSDPITRGQTALLFYHVLSTPAKGSDKPYAEKLGTLEEDSILLTSNATINGRNGWAVLAKGEGTQSYPAAGPVDPSLLGKRGWAVLDKAGRFVTLLPDESSCVTAPVERKQAYYLYLNNQRYTLSENTTVYTGSSYDAQVTTYKEYMADLRVGSVVTLYLSGDGRVTGLYRAQASTETRFVIVGSRGVSYDTFRPLTGSDYSYTIRKNGATIPISAVKAYDVATYDPVAKVLDVCDVRLTCVYENASPSPSSPNRITAAGGNEFDVMADAVWAFADRKLGDPVTLLFTSSGKVAGLLPQEADVSATPCFALGVITGDGFQMLGCDLTLKLPDGAATEMIQWEILNASSTQRGTLSLTPAGTSINAQFNTVYMSLANMRVSPGVQIYERTLSGLLPKNLTELPASVTAIQYHKDSSGLVDLVILAPYSGDGLDYGRVDVVSGYQVVQLPSAQPDGDGDEFTAKWLLQTVQKLVFTGQDGTKTYSIGGARYYSSGYGAVTEYNGTVSVTYLQSISKVPSSAFYTQDGVTYVQTSNGIYQVDENVQCFNAAASYRGGTTPPAWVIWMLSIGGIWEGELPADVPIGEPWYSNDPNVVKFSSLGECRNFADTVTIFFDSTSQRVRVIEAGE